MGSSILLRMMGVARGDKSSGNYRTVKSTEEEVSSGQRTDQSQVNVLTSLMRSTFLMSSSVAFLKSWSNGLASSLKSPTSSQFFKKRVGVGVWSAAEDNHQPTGVKSISYIEIYQLQEHLPAMMTLSFLAGPNFRVISCLCLWTAKWSSFVNLYVRSEKKRNKDNETYLQQ